MKGGGGCDWTVVVCPSSVVLGCICCDMVVCCDWAAVSMIWHAETGLLCMRDAWYAL